MYIYNYQNYDLRLCFFLDLVHTFLISRFIQCMRKILVRIELPHFLELHNTDPVTDINKIQHSSVCVLKNFSFGEIQVSTRSDVTVDLIYLAVPVASAWM